ncbi:hypothetical protein [Streptomyces sp. NPDC001401]|uniref:hypothetical protein n=1 Tax=Streptomyces sp. NPDC001401 TaxID=3364570 RepID=UPI0036C7B09A
MTAAPLRVIFASQPLVIAGAGPLEREATAWAAGRVSSHRVLLGFGATSPGLRGARVLSPPR